MNAHERNWVIPDFLPEGLSILAGKPKIGKSWLGLQLALTTATGGEIMKKQVEQGPVLYLALEDPPRRLKDRMLRQRWPTGHDLADFMVWGYFVKEIGDLSRHGEEVLAHQICKRKYRLVVIDGLSRAISGGMYALTINLSSLQESAYQENCAVLLIDHHRAPGSSIIDVLKWATKATLIDTAWGLYRDRGASAAKLAIIGREIEERTLAVALDKSIGCWQRL